MSSRTDFRVIVPARYASTRLPGKMLCDLGGRPMVVHTAERARASGAREVWIATDHEEIAEAARAHGHAVVMTSSHHASGTERVAEATSLLGWGQGEIVVNVQGDEPLIEPETIVAVAQALADDPEAAIATASHPIDDAAVLFDINAVKVVCDHQGNALYFSRAPIPYARDTFGELGASASCAVLPAGMPVERHVGIYAYRVRFLRHFLKLAPCPLETFEVLEQLRALWYGHRVRVVQGLAKPEPGVDTADDLARVRARLS